MQFPPTIPPKEAIAQLAVFEGLALRQIHLVTEPSHAEQAVAELSSAQVVGFDTEAKPTFRRGERSEGPHVFQFATLDKAFVFQSSRATSHAALMELLQCPTLTKVGFGLDGDLVQIKQRFGIRPANTIDLDRNFRKLGYRHAVGARSAIAMLFGRRFAKSKSLSTSNWACSDLSGAQLLYAANDAYAALRVYHAFPAAAPPSAPR